MQCSGLTGCHTFIMFISVSNSANLLLTKYSAQSAANNASCFAKYNLVSECLQSLCKISADCKLVSESLLIAFTIHRLQTSV